MALANSATCTKCRHTYVVVCVFVYEREFVCVCVFRGMDVGVWVGVHV